LLNTNVDKLVKISVMGEIVSPKLGSVYRISANGSPVVLPGTGGITYNVRVGDLATGWMGDHVEPGVSVKNKESDMGSLTAFMVLTCVGNEAIVVSGDAKGEKGVVTGKHGWHGLFDHILVDFSYEVMDKLVIGDKILIKAFGVGLRIIDHPALTVMNADPSFLDLMNINSRDSCLEVPVTHIIPAGIMGSGLGRDESYAGDYDIQLFDENICRDYGLEDLRLGDIVAIQDADNSFGRIYKKGAMTVGIVVHMNSLVAGHGPGVMTLLTSSKGELVPRIDKNANIAKLMKLRE